MKEILGSESFMGEELNTTVPHKLSGERTRMMNLMKLSCGCRRTTGRNIRETFDRIVGRDREWFISEAEDGWATSKTDSQTEKVCSYQITAIKLLECGKKESFSNDNMKWN